MMPIKPEDRARYPKDWAEISKRIRFGRADSRCECVGECRTGHHTRCRAVHGKTHPITGSLVILTTAHLDRIPEHCDDDNLAALCQRCHLAYDAGQHAATRARNRAKAATEGMIPLFIEPTTTGETT